MREPEITLLGAKNLALSMEKANQGFPAKEILTNLAFNLGLIRYGTQPSTRPIAYNPIEHEDTVGGLLPGDIVVALEPGWMYKIEVLIRAKVRRNNTP